MEAHNPTDAINENDKCVDNLVTDSAVSYLDNQYGG